MMALQGVDLLYAPLNFRARAQGNRFRHAKKIPERLAIPSVSADRTLAQWRSRGVHSRTMSLFYVLPILLEVPALVHCVKYRSANCIWVGIMIYLGPLCASVDMIV